MKIPEDVKYKLIEFSFWMSANKVTRTSEFDKKVEDLIEYILSKIKEEE